MTILALLVASLCRFGQKKSLTDVNVGSGYENQKYEVALFLGMFSCEGDLHCFSDQNLNVFSEATFATGLSFKKNINEHFRVSVNYITTKLTGSDANFTGYSGHHNRDFSFKNRINEVSVGIDYAPFGHKFWKVMPFVQVGMSAVFGNAKTDYKSSTQSAQLQTRIDNDVKDASNTSFPPPIGFGIKANLSDKITIQADAA